MDQLKSKIKRLRRKNASHRWFVPEVSFYSVMTKDAVHPALSNWPSYRREEIAQRVLERGRKIFGILILHDQAAQLARFIEADQLEDAKLPFKEEILVQDIRLSKEDARDFNEKQWEFIAPIFSRGTLNRHLVDSTVLPFTNEKEVGHGSFGKVYAVTLDSDHQKLGERFPETVRLLYLHVQPTLYQLTTPKFARKEFHVDTDYQKENRTTLNHQKELENLAILSHLRHPNIVGLLGSYTYDGKHNLLFELAQDGNLAGLLAAERPTQFASDETLVIALAALSSAVEHVHDLTERKLDLELIGCHHDLRPRNILVSGASFILADFGLSTIKSSSQNSETPFKHVGDDYIAPECEDWDNRFQAGTVHRSSDIWSFGCIIAEVATYMVLGHQGIKEFRQARQHKVRAFILCQFHHGPRSPSDAVNDWLLKLERSCTPTCALLVHLVRQILCMDQSKRPKAKEVTWWLRLISLYELAGAVGRMFRQVRDDGESLDMVLECTRFDAWRYAIGILSLDIGSTLQHPPGYDAMPQFDAILGCLFRLRQDLTQRLSRGAPRPNLAPLLNLNNELQDFLSNGQKEASREYFNISIMERDDDLLERFQTRGTSVALDHEIRMRANIKYMTSLLERDSSSNHRAMLVESSAVELVDRVGDHQLGRFGDSQAPRTVWVEWRVYEQHGADEHTMEILYSRAANIAGLLSQEKPEAFRTLGCSAFFHEPIRGAFGLVFDIPTSAASIPSLRPKCLREVIKETTTKPGSWPDLDDRFKLASSLAASLLELHTVGWLHKSLTPSNIVFFLETGDLRSPLIQEPFLVGFNHSRPNDPHGFSSRIAELSSRDYQHPRYLTQNHEYRPEYDYYSLGIILMEIGFWAPLCELTNRPQYKGLSYEERRQELLRNRVPRLSQQMGREYCKAVRYCIQFGSTEEEPGSPKAEGLVGFAEQVVARLRRRLI